MQTQYYYLVSGLVDLYLDTGKQPVKINDFISMCSEQMKPADFDFLKKLFLFNDMKNALNYTKSDFNYITPSYYNEDEFKESLKDTDSFLPFMAEYFYYKSIEKRLYPELMEIDEIVLLFYLHLDDLQNDFLKDYYLFELDLQNITTALSLKTNKLPLTNKIIPFGDNYNAITKSTSPDFGLSQEINYIDKLIDLYEADDLLKIEKTIEDIRWEWLDEKVLLESFSGNVVYSYAIKLNSVERWMGMDNKKGREMLENLIDSIKSSVNINSKDTAVK